MRVPIRLSCPRAVPPTGNDREAKIPSHRPPFEPASLRLLPRHNDPLGVIGSPPETSSDGPPDERPSNAIKETSGAAVLSNYNLGSIKALDFKLIG